MSNARAPLLTSEHAPSSAICIQINDEYIPPAKISEAGLAALDKQTLPATPVLVDIKHNANESTVEDALVALDKAEDILVNKHVNAGDYRFQKKYCKYTLTFLYLVSIAAIIIGAVGMPQCEKNDGGCEDKKGGYTASIASGSSVLFVTILLTLNRLIRRYCCCPVAVDADEFHELTATEAKEMQDHLTTVSTVGESLDAKWISLEGDRWTRKMSAGLFSNIDAIRHSLSEQQAKMKKWDKTHRELMLVTIGMFGSINNDARGANLASIITDYAVCPRVTLG